MNRPVIQNPIYTLKDENNIYLYRNKPIEVDGKTLILDEGALYQPDRPTLYNRCLLGDGSSAIDLSNGIVGTLTLKGWVKYAPYKMNTSADVIQPFVRCTVTNDGNNKVTVTNTVTGIADCNPFINASNFGWLSKMNSGNFYYEYEIKSDDNLFVQLRINNGATALNQESSTWVKRSGRIGGAGSTEYLYFIINNNRASYNAGATVEIRNLKVWWENDGTELTEWAYIDDLPLKGSGETIINDYTTVPLPNNSYYKSIDRYDNGVKRDTAVCEEGSGTTLYFNSGDTATITTADIDALRTTQDDAPLLPESADYLGYSDDRFFNGSTSYVAVGSDLINSNLTGSFTFKVSFSNLNLAQSGFNYVFNGDDIFLARYGSAAPNRWAFGNFFGWCIFEFTTTSTMQFYCIHDTSETGFDRYKMYVNGSFITRFGTDGIYSAPQNEPSAINLGARNVAQGFLNFSLEELTTYVGVYTDDSGVAVDRYTKLGNYTNEITNTLPNTNTTIDLVVPKSSSSNLSVTGAELSYSGRKDQPLTVGGVAVNLDTTRNKEIQSSTSLTGYSVTAVYGEVATTGAQIQIADIGIDVTNYIRQSEDFTASDWLPSQDITVTANTTTNPINGGTTADTLAKSVSANQFRNITQYTNVSCLVVGEQYTYSVYVKDIDAVSGRLFAITSGAVSNRNWTTGGEDVGDGWRRHTLTFVATETYETFYIYPKFDTAAGSIYVFGAMLNKGDVAGSYKANNSSDNTAGLAPSILYNNNSSGYDIKLARVDLSNGVNTIQFVYLGGIDNNSNDIASDKLYDASQVGGETGTIIYDTQDYHTSQKYYNHWVLYGASQNKIWFKSNKYDVNDFTAVGFGSSVTTYRDTLATNKFQYAVPNDFVSGLPLTFSGEEAGLRNDYILLLTDGHSAALNKLSLNGVINNASYLLDFETSTNANFSVSVYDTYLHDALNALLPTLSDPLGDLQTIAPFNFYSLDSIMAWWDNNPSLRFNIDNLLNEYVTGLTYETFYDYYTSQGIATSSFDTYDGLILVFTATYNGARQQISGSSFIDNGQNVGGGNTLTGRIYWYSNNISLKYLTVNAPISRITGTSIEWVKVYGGFVITEDLLTGLTDGSNTDSLFGEPNEYPFGIHLNNTQKQYVQLPSFKTLEYAYQSNEEYWRDKTDSQGNAVLDRHLVPLSLEHSDKGFPCLKLLGGSHYITLSTTTTVNAWDILRFQVSDYNDNVTQVRTVMGDDTSDNYFIGFLNGQLNTRAGSSHGYFITMNFDFTKPFEVEIIEVTPSLVYTVNFYWPNGTLPIQTNTINGVVWTGTELIGACLNGGSVARPFHGNIHWIKTWKNNNIINYWVYTGNNSYLLQDKVGGNHGTLTTADVTLNQGTQDVFDPFEDGLNDGYVFFDANDFSSFTREVPTSTILFKNSEGETIVATSNSDSPNSIISGNNIYIERNSDYAYVEIGAGNNKPTNLHWTKGVTYKLTLGSINRQGNLVARYFNGTSFVTIFNGSSDTLSGSITVTAVASSSYIQIYQNKTGVNSFELTSVKLEILDKLVPKHPYNGADVFGNTLTTPQPRDARKKILLTNSNE